MDTEELLQTILFFNLIIIVFFCMFFYKNVLGKVFLKPYLESGEAIVKFLKAELKIHDADYCYLLMFRNGDRFTAGNPIMRVEIVSEAVSDAFLDKSLFDTHLKSAKLNKFVDVFFRLEKNKFIIIDATEQLSEDFQSKKALVERGMKIGYYHSIYDEFGDMKAVLCYEYSYNKMPVPYPPYPQTVGESIKNLKYLILK